MDGKLKLTAKVQSEQLSKKKSSVPFSLEMCQKCKSHLLLESCQFVFHLKHTFKKKKLSLPISCSLHNSVQIFCTLDSRCLFPPG